MNRWRLPLSQYERGKYRSYTGRADLYVCFYDVRARASMKPGGYFGNRIFKQVHARLLRYRFTRVFAGGGEVSRNR